MILENVNIIGSDKPVSIRINKGRIAEVSASPITVDDSRLQFACVMIFPGLINSHDHLDFNLFPQLGDKTYRNYREWGNYIHAEFKREIAEIVSIPVGLRAQWGVYKNLLCGITTVIDHGEKTGFQNEIINIVKKSHDLHSVGFQQYWKLKLNNPVKKYIPINIHVGEGTDAIAAAEIDQLTRWNLLRRKLIGVHAVTMNERQAKKFKAIVWCPESNYFLLNKTAPVDLLKNHTTLLFGTDSTLTGSWDIWEHLRFARETCLLSDEELYKTLNKNAANTWQLNSGVISERKDADLVVAKTNSKQTGYNAFFSIRTSDILLVISKGKIRLFDESLLDQIELIDLNKFSKVAIGGVVKYVYGDLPALMGKIRNYKPEAEFPVTIPKPVFA